MSERGDDVKAGAMFSPCRTYRYILTREWGEGRRLMVVGLNPSTADETADDPTIRRCIGFARAWGFGSLLMANLFAFRATDPQEMMAVSDPVGLLNDVAILDSASKSDLVLAAWGAHGGYRNRNAEVCRLIPAMVCLGRTKAGHPRHPLYVRADTPPQAYEAAGAARAAKEDGR